MIALAASYLSRLYTADQLKVLLAKAASVAYGATYSSTCDYFGSNASVQDKALNAIDKKVCL